MAANSPFITTFFRIKPKRGLRGLINTYRLPNVNSSSLNSFEGRWSYVRCLIAGRGALYWFLFRKPIKSPSKATSPNGPQGGYSSVFCVN